MVSRQSLPVFGRQGTYLEPGHWELGISFRHFLSNKHYQGGEPFTELDPFGPDNRQIQFNFDLTYALTKRFSLGVSIPLHFNDFALNRIPPGSGLDTPVRDSTSISALGDISVRGKFWVFDTERASRNLAVSMGLKIPTGDRNARDDIYGTVVPVDWSAQPGDGGWGFAPSVEGFVRANRFTFFGSALYLFNPRNTTGTPAFFPSLSGRPAPENSAADQFSALGGVAIQMPHRWPTPTLAYRVEGVPISDALGDSDGFRRPGTIGFVEPGFSYSFRSHNFAVSFPIRQYTNVKDSPVSNRREDATVPDWMLLISYSKRF